jgi:hypothetical protein
MAREEGIEPPTPGSRKPVLYSLSYPRMVGIGDSNPLVTLNVTTPVA